MFGASTVTTHASHFDGALDLRGRSLTGVVPLPRPLPRHHRGIRHAPFAFVSTMNFVFCSSDPSTFRSRS